MWMVERVVLLGLAGEGKERSCFGLREKEVEREEGEFR